MKLRRPLRSATGGHTLLPATHTTHQHVLVALGTLPVRTFLRWTFGRSTVIWRIWPAVLFHTAFAALVVSISLRTRFKLGVPSVLLTLLGMVIGFVISYRTMSGYERYWQGRTSWSDVMRTTRTMGRLVWYHVPLRMGPAGKKEDSGKSAAPNGKEKEVDAEKAREIRRLMLEKKMALDLIEGFAVALKHHLRGEVGIYYEDLYSIVRPLHRHAINQQKAVNITAEPEEVEDEDDDLLDVPHNPVILSINSYGTTTRFRRGHLHHDSLASFASSSSSDPYSAENTPLLPSAAVSQKGLLNDVAGDLIPFSGIIGDVLGFLKRTQSLDEDDQGGVAIRDRSTWTHTKHRPKIAGGGDNVPLQVIRCLTSWLSILEERGSVPGSSLGGMFGCLNQFEDSLAALEKILTTPLPFVFSVHLSTIWLYLFALPFQLVDVFGWYSIPGVGIASFIYLGFIATGEEIEQPFGYDENDLDLDMFCQDVIHADMEHLKRTATRNSVLGPFRDGEGVVLEGFDPTGEHGRIEEVFGYHDY